MAQHNTTKEANTPLLLAPGPTEVSPEVLAALAHPAESHFSQDFCNSFGEVLTQTRELFQTSDPNSQPFILGGSGSLGWDFVATNFLATGSNILCLSTGFFADAFADCLAAYGHNVTKLTVPIGSAPDLAVVERELSTRKYAALVATHVETSTAVLTHLPPLQKLIKQYSPSTLFVVDAVASLVAEELRFDAWELDVVLTGSQKALGCPPGLSLIMTSARALAAAEAVKDDPHRPRVWYASLQRWLPIMRTYERREAGYFATPPTQLVRALSRSLSDILAVGMHETWRRHRDSSALVKRTLASLGLGQLAAEPADQANGLTAFWMPEGVEAKDLLKRVLAKGVMLSAGMHKEVGTKYLRFGHMGYSATSSRGDIQVGLTALTEALVECYTERTAAEEEKLRQHSGLETVARQVQVADG